MPDERLETVRELLAAALEPGADAGRAAGRLVELTSSCACTTPADSAIDRRAAALLAFGPPGHGLAGDGHRVLIAE